MKDHKYQKERSREYVDEFEDDYLDFLEDRIKEGRRILKPNGSIFVHLDCREVHYVKVMLDKVFGRDHFMNEIIWAYDYGARTKKKWPAKHDNILWYVKDPKDYQYHIEECDRIPYLSPNRQTAERAALGKTPTDTWWNTIVPTNSKENTGYPTQKPLAILERIVKVHSVPGDLLMDFFAGSGSFGEAAIKNGRNCILIDSNPQALEVMEKRFQGAERKIVVNDKVSYFKASEANIAMERPGGRKVAQTHKK